MPSKRKDIKGQLLFDFRTKKPAPAISRQAKLAQIKETKTRALRLTKQAYANIMNNPAIHSGISPKALANYKREFGQDIGALSKGRVSAIRAQAITGKTIAFMQRFGINPGK